MLTGGGGGGCGRGKLVGRRVRAYSGVRTGQEEYS